jgi:hypothetical protein
VIKYILAVIVYVLMLRIEATGNLKLAWGALCSLMAYMILFLKELS